jgi:hypothetical protein
MAEPDPASIAYNIQVITRGIREFVSRDWQAARDSKIDYWGDRIARLGPLEALRVAEELRQQALLQDPAWPRPPLRRDDVAFHVGLVEKFRRAAAARRR